MKIIDDATAEDIIHVARNLRDKDFEEFEPLFNVTTQEEIADVIIALYAARTDLVAVYVDDVAVGIAGFIEVRPNVISLIFFGTDDFPKAGAAFTRFLVQRLFPRFKAAGIHRFECVSHGAHTAAHEWLKVLGLHVETPLDSFGKNREQYLQFAWVAPHVG